LSSCFSLYRSLPVRRWRLSSGNKRFAATVFGFQLVSILGMSIVI
jgi:hypothetical protein